MLSLKKHIYLVLLIVAGISLAGLQLAWVNHAYKLEYQQIMNNLKEAFNQAYQKEQTYRIPVVDIVNPGAITIQSCGTEEIFIVRKCPDADTIVYNNNSGHSVEHFINHVFLDLREQIMPLNIYCLADLFAGMLHDRNIPISFIIERFNTSTGKVLESSILPGKKQPEITPENTIISEVSDKESVRAILQVTSGAVLSNMTGTLFCTSILTVIIILCFIFLHKQQHTRKKDEHSFTQETKQTVQLQNSTFQIGYYHFDPGKNELSGFGESIQLNKKENAILHALCAKKGNVVERSALLEENWGNSGIIYSRSLDTYFATLRKYLKKDPSIQIVTIKGVGYKLVVTD